MDRSASLRGPGQATACEPRTCTSPSGVSQVTVTPSSSWSIPVTRCPQRTSTSGEAAIRSSRSASVSHCDTLTNGGKGERPRSAKVKLNSSASRWKVRAVVQVTPRRAISAPTPTASHTSSTSRCWQMALLPMGSRSGRASRTTTGRPQRASRRAAVWPTGPAPRTSTGGPGRGVVIGGAPVGSALQLVPHGAVALGGPDDGALGAGELVPQPGDVEGQAVLEDGPPAVLRGQGGVGRLEGLLEGAAGAVHVADGALHGEQEVTGLLDGGVDLVAAARDPPAATDQLPRSEGLDPVEGPGGPVEVERVAGVERGLGLDQVAGEEDLLLGQPGDDVALGVAAAEELQDQLAAVAAELDGQLVAEGHGGPGQAGDGLGLLEQPRHPAVLALPVLLAALLDEVLGLLGADDHLGVEGAGAQHADGVVVRQDQVADRLVGVLAELGQPDRKSVV